MAGAPIAPTVPGAPTAGSASPALTQQQMMAYYGSMPPAQTPTVDPSQLFSGLGPAQLDPSGYQQQTLPDPTTTISGQMQDFKPMGLMALQPASYTQALNDFNKNYGHYDTNTGAYDLNLTDFQDNGTQFSNPQLQKDLTEIGLGGSQSNGILTSAQTAINNNLGNYNAVNSANADNQGYLQQAAIAQNKLLGNLNSRGLLQSFENGGMGTADMQQLKNSLSSASADQGLGLQNELSGLSQNDAMYQLALQNYNNQVGSFTQQQQNNIPGLTDILGTGLSALPLIAGL